MKRPSARDDKRSGSGPDKRSPRHMRQLTVPVSTGLIDALDHYATEQGLSRTQAVQLALCSGPLVRDIMAHGGVASRDVLGP